MIIAFTGHRPNKLGFYKPNPLQSWIRSEITRILSELNPQYTIVGGALGVDTWAAQISYSLQIPYILAVPFLGQEKIWPQSSKDEYNLIKSRAKEVVVVCDGGYSAAKMQIRNQWMVDRCNKLIAVWDGTSGGTGNCVAYANKLGREIIRINPKEFNDN